MERNFGTALSELRHSRDLNQRALAADLHISQALLSHYENGTREPGLPFVCRVCDYFGVSADYILGRSDDEATGACATGAVAELNRSLSEISDNALRKAAMDYVDGAAKKMILHLTYHEDLSLAEQTATMAETELQIVRLRNLKHD
ncbi:MAG: helix-turn-helix transcriptional regulator [Oscillospiraceae bacterium]|nr:helix-turn-helix transcriptional regulator [Oscillospiraceae bacterium]